MYKIAILGCENSHADQFVNFIKNNEQFSGIEVVGAYTCDETAEKNFHEKHGIYMAKNYDEFVGKIDGLIVTARDGRNHLKYARPYFADRIPMFIDKPITSSTRDALELARLAIENGVKLCGGSSCINFEEIKSLAEAVKNAEKCTVYGGSLRAPINMNNPYGDFWFYSQHLVQMMQAVFGYYPKTVKAYTSGAAVNVVVRYDEYDVFLNFVDMNFKYFISASLKDGVVSYTEPDTSKIFQLEFMDFYTILCGGEPRQSLKDFIAPVFVLEAIERSLKSGSEESVEEIKIG